MIYILNVPLVPQQEFHSAADVAAILVEMKKAINPGIVEQRIRDLNETDVLIFGNVSVIAVGDDKPAPVAVHDAPIVLDVIERQPEAVLAEPAVESVALAAVEAEQPRTKRFERSRS